MTDRSSANAVREPSIPKRPNADAAPLSFPQLQMWLMDQMAPGNPAYVLPVAYRLKGPLDVAALENSFNEVIRRHEILRTTFTVNDGEPLQVIHEPWKIAIRVRKLDSMTPDGRERQLHALASEEAGVSFDLSRLPLLRVLLFNISADEHVLLINLHHIVADGISLRLMLDDLDRHYQVFRAARPDDKADVCIQYADYALWQRQTVATKSYSEEIAFWRRQLRGTPPVLELPADLPRPLVQSFKGSNIFFEIPNAQARDVAALGAREGCTLFTTLLAAFQVLLQRYSGADDL